MTAPRVASTGVHVAPFLLLAVIASTTLYVQPSRVNLRATPDEKGIVVAKIPIGTAVESTPVTTPGWCSVAVVGGASGFVRCDLLATQRPTLETVATDGSGDAVARKFFLSPSVFTILEAANEDLQKLLFDALRTSSGGTDLRPVRRPWNETRFNEELLSWGPVDGEAKTRIYPDALPPARASLWRSIDDVFVISVGPGIERTAPGAVARGPGGRAEVRWAARANESVYDSRGRALIEYVKLLDVARPTFTTSGPVQGYEAPSGVAGVGIVTATWEKTRPAVALLTRKELVMGELVDVRSVVGDPYECGAFAGTPTATIATAAPIRDRVLTALITRAPLEAQRARVTKLGRRSWTADLNGDGIADLATLTGVRKGLVSEESDVEVAILVVNIAGEWRVASMITDGSGDCT